jgi:hypothetical protein
MKSSMQPAEPDRMETSEKFGGEKFVVGLRGDMPRLL